MSEDAKLMELGICYRASVQPGSKDDIRVREVRHGEITLTVEELRSAVNLALMNCNEIESFKPASWWIEQILFFGADPSLPEGTSTNE